MAAAAPKAAASPPAGAAEACGAAEATCSTAAAAAAADPPPRASFATLPDAVLERVFEFVALDGVEHLLHARRLGRRVRALVDGAEAAWKAAYISEYGASGAAIHGTDTQDSWSERLWNRRLRERHEERQRRAARRARALATAQALAASVHALAEALKLELSAAERLAAERAELERRRAAAVGAELGRQVWQLRAVVRAQGQVLEPDAPADAAARTEELRQRAAVSQLEVAKLRATLAAKLARLTEAEARIKALER
jgi:hypothetical protein